MRAVTFSNRKLQRLLNTQFINTYTDTTGDPTAGSSIKHSPRDTPGSCIRGNGKQNVQTIFMTPDGEIFHVATGYLSAEDLLAESVFAGKLFAALQESPESPEATVSSAHVKRLQKLGFSQNEIQSRRGFEALAAMQNAANGDNLMDGLNSFNMSNGNRPGSNNASINPFATMIRAQFLSDNKFSIANPLMRYESFEADPGRLVGRGKSFFGSSSSNSNGSSPR